MNNVDLYGIIPQIVTSKYTTTQYIGGTDQIKTTKTKHLETPTGITSVETVEYTRYNRNGEAEIVRPEKQIVDISI